MNDDHSTAASKIIARTIRQLTNQLQQADQEIARLHRTLADERNAHHVASQTLKQPGERIEDDFFVRLTAFMTNKPEGEVLTLQQLAERRMADLEQARREASTPCGDCAKRDAYAANEAKQREGLLEDAWQFRDWELVSRLQDEERQRGEAEPDPLDEDDHRDRIDVDGGVWRTSECGYWHLDGAPQPTECPCWQSLARVDAACGPLAFAPDAAQETPSTATNADETQTAQECIPDTDRPKLNAQTGLDATDPDPLHLTILRNTVSDWRNMSTPSVSTRGWQRGWRAGVDLCTAILAEIADEYEREMRGGRRG